MRHAKTGRTGRAALRLPGNFSLVAVMLICLLTKQGDASSFGVARSAAPVLNTPAFGSVFGGSDGKTLKTDRCGQVRELEFIALQGTAFRLVDTIRHRGTTVYRVETDDYPAPPGVSLYLDSRFIEIRTEQPGARPRSQPPREKIIATLKAAVGAPYVWGGNLVQGVRELRGLYYHGRPPSDIGSELVLAGLDCSGLLYQATNGWTPRNTSGLISFGTGLSIAGKTAQQLSRQLEPLDLIVWNGHVIIVLDSETAIESRLECGTKGNGGVMTTPLRRRLQEIMRLRRPVNQWSPGSKQRDIFVVRRWIGQL